GYKWYINRSWLDKVTRFGDKERPDLWAEAEISRISYYAGYRWSYSTSSIRMFGTREIYFLKKDHSLF
ncbi:hypothetical protein ATANTOWER_004831, partial [Ataeniobius toweri]|nr:hypothetical protein [Ataeniobius toweri]